MQRKSLNNFIKSCGHIKKEVQGLVNTFANSVEKDLKHIIVERDFSKLAKKFQRERQSIEKMVEKSVYREMEKIHQFIGEQKERLEKLQAKVESYLPEEKAKKRPSRKKTTKKVRKKTAKKARKKAAR